MSSHIKIAVPPDADPALTEKLFTAIREKHPSYDLRRTESSNGKYHWQSGEIEPSENASFTESHIDEHGRLVGSSTPVPIDPIASDVTRIIHLVTGHTR